MQIIDLASFSIIIASISVFVGVTLAVLQLRDQVKNRQAQLVVQLYSQFSSQEFLENMDYTFDYFDNIDPDNLPESWVSEVPTWKDTRMNSVMAFFEGIGVLVRRKLIDINLVADMLSTPIIMVWEANEPRVMARRRALKRNQVWDWFEYLYHEIQKIPTKSWS
ncbi:MAG: hypothetical protein ACFFDD_14190 [Promethearchaeota archaeon]